MKQFKVKVKNHFTNYNWKIKAKIITIVVLMLLIVFDQVIKLVVKQNLTLDEPHRDWFMPGFITIKYVINGGSAFGLNQGKTSLLITIAFIVAFILLIWWTFSRTTSHIVGIVFILAGTIGNLIDRFLNHGGVIDFLNWELFKPYTIFNLADMMVTIGICIIVIAIIVSLIKNFVYNHKEKQAAQKTKKVNKEEHEATRKTV